MGSAIVVGINKGESAWVTLQGLPLPNGLYKDVLSDREIWVSDGKSQMLLEKNDFQVFNFIQQQKNEDTVINFHISGYRSQYGENLFITGDCEELGNWDVSKAVKLEYINSNTWAINVPFKQSVNKFINYKYFVSGYNKLIRENTIGRRKLVPPKGFIVWKDEWEH